MGLGIRSTLRKVYIQASEPSILVFVINLILRLKTNLGTLAEADLLERLPSNDAQVMLDCNSFGSRVLSPGFSATLTDQDACSLIYRFIESN